MGGLRSRGRRAPLRPYREIYTVFRLAVLSCRGICAARRSAQWRLSRGDSVLESAAAPAGTSPICGKRSGPTGRIYGIDISPGMLQEARTLREAKDWRNIELCECDAADYVAPAPLDAVLFSLSYNTMLHHRTVLRRAWQQLRPGGRLSSWTPRCRRARRPTDAAVQPLADEAHHARQPADSPVAGARRRRRAMST